MDFTLPVGGSRGTSGEGLIFQLNPSRTILPQRTNTVHPPRFVVPPQRPSRREGKKTNLTLPSGRRPLVDLQRPSILLWGNVARQSRLVPWSLGQPRMIVEINAKHRFPRGGESFDIGIKLLQPFSESLDLPRLIACDFGSIQMMTHQAHPGKVVSIFTHGHQPLTKSVEATGSVMVSVDKMNDGIESRRSHEHPRSLANT
jgi:hypothetical protein